jgi:hypothetical protein
VNLVLKEKVRMHEVVAMSKMVLVGRFHGRRLGERALKDWVISNMEPFLGYMPVYYTLTRDWLAFVFQSTIDVEKVIDSCWKWGLNPLSLKKWTPIFYTKYEKVDITLDWVKLPSLSINFWSMDVFREIGKAFVHYYEADLSYRDIGSMATTRILVGLDMNEGLAKSLFYKHNNRYFNKNNNIIRLTKCRRELTPSPRDQSMHISIPSQSSLQS